MTGPSDEDLRRLLEELIGIDSVNPGLDASGRGEARIADYVHRWAAGHGLAVERTGDPDRPSLIITTTGTAPGPALLLCGHLDTVGHGTMTDPVTPRLAGGHLHGRGAYDMKGGLAAALAAAARLNHPGYRGRVIVAAVADEEHLSAGAAAVLATVWADAAIVTEPTELTVAIAHRGFVWIEITVLGVAAHGSRPQLGVDAIVATGPVLTGIAGLQRRLAATGHPDLGPGTVHASLISGGLEESTIPDRCTLIVERRTIPGETAAQALAEIEAVLAAARSITPGATFRAQMVTERSPMETPRDAPIVRAALAAQQQVLGEPRPAGGVSYWADAALISAAGIPTILLGPAGDGAHAETEWVDLASVFTTARLLTTTAQIYAAPG